MEGFSLFGAHVLVGETDIKQKLQIEISLIKDAGS